MVFGAVVRQEQNATVVGGIPCDVGCMTPHQAHVSVSGTRNRVEYNTATISLQASSFEDHFSINTSTCAQIIVKTHKGGR